MKGWAIYVHYSNINEEHENCMFVQFASLQYTKQLARPVK